VKYLVLVAAAAAAAVIATLVRYGSLQPCDWLKQDVAARLDVPPLIAEAKVRAEFLVSGVAEPSAADCLTSWWDFKAYGKVAE